MSQSRAGKTETVRRGRAREGARETISLSHALARLAQATPLFFYLPLARRGTRSERLRFRDLRFVPRRRGFPGTEAARRFIERHAVTFP